MFVLINLKAYDVDAAALGSVTQRVSEETGIRVAVAPQATEIATVAKTRAETWSQHLSGVTHGSHTGSLLAEAASGAGAVGCLLNHSERRVTVDQLERGLEAARRVRMETIVCANTPAQVAAATALGPDRVAVEPPELIGTGVPVSRADPDIVSDAVAAAEEIDPTVEVLCGAGISEAADVRAAMDLGADGVLLASGVAAAEDPESALRSLIEPLAHSS